MKGAKSQDRLRRGREFSRRAVLVSAAAAAGSLALGFVPVPVAAKTPAPQAEAFGADLPEITCWIVIRPDDTVVIRLARAEMGQGAFTAMSMLVAEELECDWAKVKVEFVPPAENLRRKLEWQEGLMRGTSVGEPLTTYWGAMATASGQSTRESQDYLRQAGAIARVMLIEAAAKDWNVSAFECAAAAGIITHTPSGRKTSFAKVATAAADIPPPTRVPLKDPKSWKLASKATRQLDTSAKVDGSLVYAIDVRRPDMVYAAIAQCPVFGGKLAGFEPAAATAQRGVLKAVQLDDVTVCVIAETFWQARTALDAMAITWDEGPNASATSASIAAAQRTGLVSDDAAVAFEAGDTIAALMGAAKIVDAEYATPFLHQAGLEPMNCTAEVKDGKVEVWVGTQDGEGALAVAAAAGGVDHDRVRVNPLHLGGGFGRRGAPHDAVRFAVLAAKQTDGRPVKLIYTREEDMTHGFYRPASFVRFKGALDAKGNLTGLYVRIAGQSINAWHRPSDILDNIDRSQASGLLAPDLAYGIPNLRVEVAMRNTHVPPGWWRGQNYSQNSFYRECFIDELAKAAGKDPLEFRKALIGKAAKPISVLDLVAEKSNWSSAPAKGMFRGLAFEQSFGSVQATVAEVSIGPDGQLRVLRIVNAIDCGHAVNPNSIDQQLAGAAVMAMTAMQYGEITIERGRVAQRNFDTYRMLRLNEMPVVENHILASYETWGGVGEVSLPSIAPAICNAIFAATGKRIRSLPLKNHTLTRT